MPRKAKFPPAVYHHPSGQARVRVHEGGKAHDLWLGPHGSERAMAAYARLVAEMAANGGRLPARYKASKSGGDAPTVSAVVVRWLEEELPKFGGKGRTPGQYGKALSVLVRLYGPTPAADFDADALEALRLAMASGSWMTADELEEHRWGTGGIRAGGAKCRRKEPRDAGWCRNTVNRHAVRIRTVWRWAERKKLVPRGSYEHLRTLRELKNTDGRVRQTKKRVACTEDEARRVREAATPQVAAMLHAQWLTGMRTLELVLMRPCDIDRSGDVWLYRPESDKTAHLDDGYERVVPLGPACQAVLAPWLARCGGESKYLFRPRRGNARRKRYTVERFGMMVRRAAEKAGVPGFSAYRQRHAFRARVTGAMGSDAARAGLGHRSIGTTMQYNAVLDVEAAAEVARKLG